jgi:hypothetical protein
MHADKRYSGGADTAGAELTPQPQLHVAPQTEADQPKYPGTDNPDVPAPDNAETPAARPAWWAAAAWAGLIIALFVIFLRISYSFAMDSDAANNALQGWDILHGNVLLHGWIIGDATYYTFELPLYVLVESVLGLHAAVAHVVSAITYVIVAVSAILLARIGSRGPSAWIRSGVVLAFLAAPMLSGPGVSVVVEKPDHTGTAAIMLLCFLLIDRAIGRRFMPVLLGVILVLGQIGDATVLYVAVPAVAVVSLYRIIFRRLGLADRLRLPDTLTLVAAGLSVPLAMLVTSGVQHIGGYTMIAPRTGLAKSWTELGRNLSLTGKALRIVFGAFTPSCDSQQACIHASTALHMPGAPIGDIGLAFGWLCIAAALYGFGTVIFTWTRASRADQLLAVAIVVNIAAYVFSTLPVKSNARELIAVVPCAAVLAARALVPARIQSVVRTRVLIAAAAAATVLPLAAAASVPASGGVEVPLAAWLRAHGLKYGLGSYWVSSSVTLQSGGHVDVRAVKARYFGISGYPWESKASWYNPSLHYANFVIADTHRAVSNTNIPASAFEKYLGRPASVHLVAKRLILIYRRNLLTSVTSPTAAKALLRRPARDFGHHHRLRRR